MSLGIWEKLREWDVTLWPRCVVSTPANIPRGLSGDTQPPPHTEKNQKPDLVKGWISCKTLHCTDTHMQSHSSSPVSVAAFSQNRDRHHSIYVMANEFTHMLANATENQLLIIDPSCKPFSYGASTLKSSI